jgi:glycosyltransferase involved in cell wall biosynthesis
MKHDMGVLVFPNYHVSRRSREDGAIYQKPNELRFYSDLAPYFSEVAIAALWHAIAADEEAPAGHTTDITFLSLGRGGVESGFAEKTWKYVRAASRAFQLIRHSSSLIYLYLPGAIGLIAGLMARFLRKPYATYLRGGLRHSGPLVEALYRWVLRGSRFIICTGPALQHYASLATGRPAQLVSPMISFGTDEEDDPISEPSPGRPFRAIFVGTLRREKGIYDALEVARLLADTELEFELELVGNATPAVLEDLKRSIRLQESGTNVRIVEFVADPRELHAIYSNAHVLLSPSVYNEGFPRVMYEAMLTNCAIVAYAMDVYDSFLHHDRNSILVRAGDVSAIARSIQSLANDPEKYNSVVDQARRDAIDYLRKVSTLPHGQQVARYFAEFRGL